MARFTGAQGLAVVKRHRKPGSGREMTGRAIIGGVFMRGRFAGLCELAGAVMARVTVAQIQYLIVIDAYRRHPQRA